MKELPLVSLLIPMYNQKPGYLRECLESAVLQQYPNLEIVVSDNHSTLDYRELFTSFPDPRIRIVKPPRHIPVNAHFNFAASQARGEYISFLSSDDLLYADCISKVMTGILNAGGCVLGYCDTHFIDAEGKTTGSVRNGKLPAAVYSPGEMAMRMYNFSEYWIIGGIMRKDAFDKIFFDPDLIAADWLLGFQLLKYGNVWYHNEILSAIRFHKRDGDAAAHYEYLSAAHQMQRIQKHDSLIDDQDFRNVTGIGKSQQEYFKNRELDEAVITLILDFHAGIREKQQLDDIFDFYKKNKIRPRTVRLIREYEKKSGYYRARITRKWLRLVRRVRMFLGKS